MRAGIYGGSFNPVHNGHLKLARFVMDSLKLDRLFVIPANVSPFKTKNNVSTSDRVRMCRLAFPESEGFYVDETEINRGGVSYTVDTVKEMTVKNPSSELFLITGSDMLLSFDLWKDYKAILSMCTLAAVSRQSEDGKDELERFADERLRKWGRVEILPFEPFEISSTVIREKIRLGEDVSAFLPEEVNKYIQERGLYLD